MLRWLLVIVILAAIGIGGWIVFFDRIAAASIERAGSYALGVETTLDSFRLRPLAGEVALAGLAVSNPPGYQADTFLTLGRAEVAVPLAALRRDPIVIETVELHEIGVHIERGPQGANYEAILANLEQLESSSAAPEDETGGPTVVISSLVIREVDAALAMGPLGSFDVHIPEIRLANLGGGSPDGVEMSQVVAIVTQSVLRAVARESADLPLNLTADLNRRLSRIGLPGVEVPEEVTERSRELQEQLGEAGEAAGKVLEGLGGLLRRNRE